MKKRETPGRGKEQSKDLEIDLVEEQLADLIKSIEALDLEQFEVPAELNARIKTADLTELDEIERELGLKGAARPENAIYEKNADSANAPAKAAGEPAAIASETVRESEVFHRENAGTVGAPPASFQSSVEEKADGAFEITTSDDAMRAFIDFIPSRGGGLPLTLESVKGRLSEMKVVFGIKEDLLKRMIETVERTKEDKKGVIIAQGVEPASGEDGGIKFLFTESETP